MAKLGDFKTPTGVTGNVLSIGSWLQMILGGVMLIFTFAAAQNISSRVSGKAPFLDGQIEQPWKTPMAVPNHRQRNVL